MDPIYRCFYHNMLWHTVRIQADIYRCQRPMYLELLYPLLHLDTARHIDSIALESAPTHFGQIFELSPYPLDTSRRTDELRLWLHCFCHSILLHTSAYFFPLVSGGSDQ